MSEEIHRRAHKVLWSFVRSRVLRIFPAKQNKSFAPAFKVVSPSLALNCLLQLAFSPNQLLRPIAWHCDVPVFPALRFSARSSSILCSASLPPPAKRSDTVEAYLHGNARERHNSSGKIAVVIRFLRLVPFCLSDNSSINSSFNVHSFLAQTRVSWTKIIIYCPSERSARRWTGLQCFQSWVHCAWDCGQIIELVWTSQRSIVDGMDCRWHY